MLEKILSKSRSTPARKCAHGDKLSSTFRIGLSGAPGVGKSSFIETFGMFLIGLGHRVAVLAVDPSSSRTGGSILGDKTRMTFLSRDENAFIRPSPSSGTLGGVARNTNEAILLCEAAGFNIIIIETVGVGQSETMVANMVDMFVLLVAPGGGDELQGMKKGIMEISDLILVNKSDGQYANAARIAQMEYISALKFTQPRFPSWRPDVLKVSSQESIGIKEAWEKMKEFYSLLITSNSLEEQRGLQQLDWMWKIISQELIDKLKRSSGVQRVLPELQRKILQGSITSGFAAEAVLDEFMKSSK